MSKCVKKIQIKTYQIHLQKTTEKTPKKKTTHNQNQLNKTNKKKIIIIGKKKPQAHQIVTVHLKPEV